MIIMAQPMQEEDTNSFFILNDNLAKNNITSNKYPNISTMRARFYKKEILMDKRDKINFVWMRDNYDNIPAKQETKILNDQFIDIKLYENIFPWLHKFNKIMCSSVGNKNYQLLKHLLVLYKQKMLNSINTYCEKESDMIKLKNHINSTLTFFHLYWHEIKKDVMDCDWYLNEMSTLLGIYIDMELQTFQQTMDSSKLAAKLLSGLWIYLNNSKKHIFRVLLKLKFITKKYSKIYDLIFTKSFTNVEKPMKTLMDIDYVRYLLVLKIWERLKESVKEKKEVNKIALTILGSCTPNMRDELLKIIPKPPMELENKTTWLLQPNVFDLKVASNKFLAFEDAMSVRLRDSHLTNISDGDNHENLQTLFCGVQEHTIKHQRNKINNLKNNYTFKNELQSSKSNDQMFLINAKDKLKRYKKVSKLKPGEIILIDLTKEDELKANKKKIKQRNSKKLEWLELTKKRYKLQRQNNEIKCRNEMEVANVHSKENSINLTDKIVLNYLPVLDNKINQNSENCTLLNQESIRDSTYDANLRNAYGYILNKRNNELKCLLQHKLCDVSTLPLKQINTQCQQLLALLKVLDTVGQNIKVPKMILNLLKESSEKNEKESEENEMSQHTFLSKNIANNSSAVDTQGKVDSFFQPKCSINTPVSKQCQNNISNRQFIKQELLTNTNCNTTQTDTYCRNQPIYVQSDCHLHDFTSRDSHNLQATEAVQQKVSHDSHDCMNYYEKEMTPIFYHDNSIFNVVKSEDMIQNSMTDKKLICDKNIICMLSDLNKCMNVLNRIGEHIMTLHAEKQRLEYSDKTDTSTISTTVFEDDTAGLLNWVQNINSATNIEKFNKILELYEKKELSNACNCQDFHRWNDKETNIMLNQLKYDSNNCKKDTTPTSPPKEYCSYGKDNENKSKSFVCNNIKSEIEPTVKKENNDSCRILRDDVEQANEYRMTMLTNNYMHTNEFYMDTINNTSGSNQDTCCEPISQKFSPKSNVTKTRSLNEFENTDILDNILNGEITIEDEQEIWEDWQSPLMSPINHDNSNNALNYIADFFSQSEHTCANKKEEKYNIPDTENVRTPLPEGSLGTVGILNSLFDFDLTNMDFPSNNVIYSNVQAVNPRLIKKSFEADIFSTIACDTSEFSSQEKINKENVLLQKEKELCNNHNYLIDSSVDVVGFGLNTTKESLFKLPSSIKNLSSAFSFSNQSTKVVNSNSTRSEIKESFSKCSISSPNSKLDTDNITEKSYIFQKKDVDEIECFNDIVNQVSSETCTSNEIPLNILKQQDGIESPENHICSGFESNPLTVKQSLDFCDLSSSTNLMQGNTNATPQCIQQQHGSSIRQRNIQKNIQHSCKEKQNYTKKHRTEVSGQSKSSSTKLKYKNKIKLKRKKEDSSSSVVQSKHNESSLKCSQLTGMNVLTHQDVQNSSELPLSIFHVSYCQKSPQIIRTRENEYKQFKLRNIRLRNISKRTQQMLLNFHNDSVIDAIFKEDSKLEDFKHTSEDNISEDSNVSCSFKTSYLSDNKSYFNTDINKGNVMSENYTTEVLSNKLIKFSSNSLSQNAVVQSSKLTENPVIVAVDEEMPLKKRKLASKFSSTFEANVDTCSANQQKMQKKHFTSIKKETNCNVSPQGRSTLEDITSIMFSILSFLANN